MATLVLGAVGAAVGGSLGGSFMGLSAAVMGRAAGAALGRVVDQAILGGGSDAVETGRLDRIRMTGASEGAAIPRIVGRVRVGGQVIWATRFKEHRETKGGGGKGAPSSPKQTQYSYSVSLAMALCEGEIKRVGRIWADGREIARNSVEMRVYEGSESQLPDPLIEAHEGAGMAPAFRGTAYVVFEDLDLTPFGGRVPHLTFEVIRAAKADGEVLAPAELIEGVALVPGTGEYALATTSVHYDGGNGEKDAANVNTPQGVSDFRVSMRDLTEEFPRLKAVSLIVSWFGDDLRCGHCRLRPRVEHVDVDGKPQEWRVAGLSRPEAGLVPMQDGRPVYGGTPSDASVIEAIRDLNGRGIDVTFYPFILMEQMKGNGLPDPYEANEQAALPWRGRITTDLAPGLDSSSDRTEDARLQVAAFFEGAEAAPGSPERDEGYRRFILHYAHLCAAAGGVEAFCIGSEMRGLTRIRGAGDTFPAVEALRTLAQEVRTILPNTKVGYAADWSEYFGYHPQDTGNLHFHLDPLWGDPAVDFVGIDNYMPLSDWRDGEDHADQNFGSIHDLGYLQSNIEGGEGYDWHYPTPESRAAQRRDPIEDEAHDEPWVWRYKDVRSWWEKPHHDRINGVRTVMKTAWDPCSKPIRFTEYGCAAIDKGANQPNKFIDVKSSESSLPRYSNGRRDDTMQMQYLRAFLDYWGRSSKNPNSSSYPGRMIDTQHSFAWAWDARPWPHFPELSDFWSDGENHARGHWISGRSASQPLATVIAEICRASGLTNVDVSKVRGAVRGYNIASVQSARADLQPLLVAHGVEVAETDGKLIFFMRAEAACVEIDTSRLVRSDSPPVRRTRAPEAETTGRVVLHHTDASGEFETRVAAAVLPGTEGLPVTETELPLSLTRGEAQGLAERFLTESRVVRDTIELELPPSRRDVTPGRLLRLDDDSDIWRVDRLEDASGRKVQAVRTERGIFEPSDEAEVGSGRVRPLAPLPVDLHVLELPILNGEHVPHAPYVAVAAQPWPGSVAVHSSVDDSDYVLNTLIDGPSIVGTTVTELLPAAPGLWDRGPELLVRVSGGSLSAVSKRALFGGANAVAIGSGDQLGWEVLQFRSAQAVGNGVWALSDRLRGQRGTEHAARETWPIGSRVVFLDETIRQLDVPIEALGLEQDYRFGPARLPIDHEAYSHANLTANGEGLRPYAPVHLTGRIDGSDLVVSWVRRSRTGVEGWGANDVPLGEQSEMYRLRVIDETGKTLLDKEYGKPTVRISAAELSIPDIRSRKLVVEVAQISDLVGDGHASTITFG